MYILRKTVAASYIQLYIVTHSLMCTVCVCVCVSVCLCVCAVCCHYIGYRSSGQRSTLHTHTHTQQSRFTFIYYQHNCMYEAATVFLSTHVHVYLYVLVHFHYVPRFLSLKALSLACNVYTCSAGS